MDQQTLLSYLIQKDKKLADTAINSTLAGTQKGIEPIKAERAVIAALAELVRASSLPKFQPGVVGAVKESVLASEFSEPSAPLASHGLDAPPPASEGPEFDPEPTEAEITAAARNERIARELMEKDPNLAPSPPPIFAKNRGGRPRKDGTPAQPRTPVA